MGTTATRRPPTAPTPPNRRPAAAPGGSSTGSSSSASPCSWRSWCARSCSPTSWSTATRWTTRCTTATGCSSTSSRTACTTRDRGDVVVLHDVEPGLDRDLIKRVIALPGETIEMRNCEVRIDGVILDEPYLDPDGGHPGQLRRRHRADRGARQPRVRDGRQPPAVAGLAAPSARSTRTTSSAEPSWCSGRRATGAGSSPRPPPTVLDRGDGSGRGARISGDSARVRAAPGLAKRVTRSAGAAAQAKTRCSSHSTATAAAKAVSASGATRVT